MNAKITLTLPLPPSSNRYWRKTKTGRIYLSAEADAYRQEVQLLTRRSKPLTGELSITAKFYRARKSGDLDNKIKILLDSMQGNCYADDKQIVEIWARRYDDSKNPRVEVAIESLGCLYCGASAAHQNSIIGRCCDDCLTDAAAEN